MLYRSKTNYHQCLCLSRSTGLQCRLKPSRKSGDNPYYCARFHQSCTHKADQYLISYLTHFTSIFDHLKPTVKCRMNGLLIIKFLTQVVEMAKLKHICHFDGKIEDQEALRSTIILKFDGNTQKPPKVYSPPNLTDFIKKCREPTIVLSVGLLGVFPKGGNHSNLVIVDRKKKQFERFEPIGSMNLFNDNLIDQSLSNLLPNYQYIRPLDYCPMFSVGTGIVFPECVGTNQGLCVLWSMMYGHLRILYPELDRKNVISLMFSLKKRTDLIKKYITYIDQLTIDH